MVLEGNGFRGVLINPHYTIHRFSPLAISSKASKPFIRKSYWRAGTSQGMVRRKQIRLAPNNDQVNHSGRITVYRSEKSAFFFVWFCGSLDGGNESSMVTVFSAKLSESVELGFVLESSTETGGMSNCEDRLLLAFGVRMYESTYRHWIPKTNRMTAAIRYCGRCSFMPSFSSKRPNWVANDLKYSKSVRFDDAVNSKKWYYFSVQYMYVNLRSINSFAILCWLAWSNFHSNEEFRQNFLDLHTLKPTSALITTTTE